MLGSGVNLQAAQLEGAKDDNWSGLLERIAAEMGRSRPWLNGLPTSNLARWESMLRHWAEQKRVEPAVAENQLQKLACAHLRKQETASSAWKLYREFAAARFTDIISLNFDRRVALSWDDSKFVTAPARCAEGSHGETLYRHDRLAHPEGKPTKVWYPHGDTKKFSTLKLGSRRYGFYVATLEESGHGLGDSWRFKRGWTQWDGPAPAGYDAAPRWTAPFLAQSVIFIGCGLCLDEWPLWWMLHKRSRVRRKARDGGARTFCVTASGSTSAALLSVFAQYGIEVLDFPTFDAMWEGIRRAIS